MKENLVSQLSSLTTTTTTMTSDGAAESTDAGGEKPGVETPASARKRYSAVTATQVVDALHDLERIEDVITISAIARRTGVSRPTVRAVLQQECGWTATDSCRAHHAGIRRGKLLQAVAGHPGLARGRTTLRVMGWPNLQRAQHAARTGAFPALQRGRETQAARGWPGLKAVHQAPACTGYPHLAQGRANLAARGWPNWQRAQDALKAQDYLPLLDAQRLRNNEGSAPTNPATDRRHLRGRATRLAILEALQAYEDQRVPAPTLGGLSAVGSTGRMTGRALAAQLQLHPATVYAHLKQIKRLAGQELMANGLQ